MNILKELDSEMNKEILKNEELILNMKNIISHAEQKYENNCRKFEMDVKHHEKNFNIIHDAVKWKNKIQADFVKIINDLGKLDKLVCILKEDSEFDKTNNSFKLVKGLLEHALKCRDSRMDITKQTNKKFHDVLMQHDSDEKNLLQKMADFNNEKNLSNTLDEELEAAINKNCTLSTELTKYENDLKHLVVTIEDLENTKMSIQKENPELSLALKNLLEKNSLVSIESGKIGNKIREYETIQKRYNESLESNERQRSELNELPDYDSLLLKCEKLELTKSKLIAEGTILYKELYKSRKLKIQTAKQIKKTLDEMNRLLLSMKSENEKNDENKPKLIITDFNNYYNAMTREQNKLMVLLFGNLNLSSNEASEPECNMNKRENESNETETNLTPHDDDISDRTRNSNSHNEMSSDEDNEDPKPKSDVDEEDRTNENTASSENTKEEVAVIPEIE